MNNIQQWSVANATNVAFVKKCDALQKQLDELVKEAQTLAPEGMMITLIPNSLGEGEIEMEMFLETK